MKSKNLLLKISYDGTTYHGWQRQPNEKTVQGEMENAIERLLGFPAEIHGASRTDAGVHALGQSASVRCELPMPVDNFHTALNNLLTGSVRIINVEEKPDGFHARYNAVGKTYLYVIRNGEYDLFSRNYCWHIDNPLDPAAMKKAAEAFAGTHDFAAFQSTGGHERETTVRTINNISVDMRNGEKSDEIRIEVTGDGFLYNMVRIIVGTLVDAGRGKKAPESMREIIRGQDRSAAGQTAPPQGLYLKEVFY